MRFVCRVLTVVFLLGTASACSENSTVTTDPGSSGRSIAGDWIGNAVRDADAAWFTFYVSLTQRGDSVFGSGIIAALGADTTETATDVSVSGVYAHPHLTMTVVPSASIPFQLDGTVASTIDAHFSGSGREDSRSPSGPPRSHTARSPLRVWRCGLTTRP